MSPEDRSKTTARTIMIGGKAFATYTNAKRIVKLVNDVGAVVNTDPDVNNYLKVMNCKIFHLSFKSHSEQHDTSVVLSNYFVQRSSGTFLYLLDKNHLCYF